MSILKQNEKMQSVISYTLPKLYTGKKGNDWYVAFNAFSPVDGKMKIKRIKLNHIEKKSERRKYAADLIYRLSNELRRGWNPWIFSEGDGKEYATFEDVCTRYLEYITKMHDEKIYEKETYVGYLSYLRNMRMYNNSLQVPIAYIYQFNTEFVSDFLEHIWIDRKNSAQTRDNYLTFLRVFSSFLVQKRYLKTKPTDGITNIKHKVNHKKFRKVISTEHLVMIREHLERTNKHFLLACYILHYCCIRPKEMTFLRIGDFSLKNKTVTIYEDYSKNNNAAVITVNIKILKLMLDLNIFSYPSSYYLFSTGFHPGKLQRDPKIFRDYWLPHVRKKLNLPDWYQFYSLKDTGITAMMRSRIDTLSVRDQARHSSILITDTYTPHDLQECNEVLAKFDSVF